LEPPENPGRFNGITLGVEQATGARDGAGRPPDTLLIYILEGGLFLPFVVTKQPDICRVKATIQKGITNFLRDVTDVPARSVALFCDGITELEAHVTDIAPSVEPFVGQIADLLFCPHIKGNDRHDGKINITDAQV
jgi:hypothetical protein